MTSFSPISSIVAESFGVSAILVNSGVVVFLLSFILFNFAAVSAIERLGTSVTFRVCAVFTIAGVWLRFWLLQEFESFQLLMIG